MPSRALLPLAVSAILVLVACGPSTRPTVSQRPPTPVDAGTPDAGGGGCTLPSQCEVGQACALGQCSDTCTVAEQCQAGYTCDAARSRCVKSTGGLCAADGDCVGGQRCLLPEGVCSDVCASSADCTAGRVCSLRNVVQDFARVGIVALCAMPKSAGAATGATCGRHADCASGFCHLGFCTEPCAGSCPSSNLECVTSQEPLTLEAFAPIRVCLPASGTFSWDPSTWSSEYQAFVPVPGNTVAFEVLMQTSDSALYPWVTLLKDGTGAVLYDVSGSLESQPVRFYGSNAASTLLAPNSNYRGFDRSGAYAYALDTYDPASGMLTSIMPGARLFYKVAPGGAVASGTLNINFHILPMSGHTCGVVSASNAASKLATSVNQIRTLYAKAGIALGTINYYDLNRSDLGSINGDSDSELNTLFALSAGYPDAINVFLVRDLESGSVGQGGMLLGVAGGIPGPPVPGTAHSGVVVSWYYSCVGDLQSLGNVMAHEMGHFLGLFHNIEQDGSTRDDISDTDTSSRNLMYWNEQGGDQVSPGQGFVMRNNVLVE